jgi:tRNA pseudouridine38-40 synthase
MARIALGVEYDGTEFVGWQLQRSGRTVQAELQLAVSSVADSAVVVHGSGRTDSGVHADGQVAHFDADAERTPRQWVLGINANLPSDIAVRWAQPVAAEFDARRTALWRRYRYSILQQPIRSARWRRRTWWVREPLDCARMIEAAVAWLGEHDFSAFRAAGCQSHSPMRHMMSVAFDDRAPLIEIEFQANAFLQHMVRNLVGVLVDIGRGRHPSAWAQELLQARDRTRAGIAAPAQGLTLAAIGYPDVCGLPAGLRAIAEGTPASGSGGPVGFGYDASRSGMEVSS